MSHSPGGWQVHPDQIKVVEGQNGKTLATTDAIKRLLSCPVGGWKKTEYIFGSQRKKQSKKKRKKIRKKTKKKRKNN